MRIITIVTKKITMGLQDLLKSVSVNLWIVYKDVWGCEGSLEPKFGPDSWLKNGKLLTKILLYKGEKQETFNFCLVAHSIYYTFYFNYLLHFLI